MGLFFIFLGWILCSVILFGIIFLWKFRFIEGVLDFVSGNCLDFM